MYINRVNYKPNFGRAFTSEEKKSYTTLLKDAKDVLDIKDTSAIVFDFNVPSEKGKNTSIGTTFSQLMPNFISFVKDMTGITSVQLGPQGKIVPANKSPYSGTNYALGEHIIDLGKLTSNSYSSILSEDDIKTADENYPDDKVTREYKTDYDYVIGNGNTIGIQEKLLQKAYSNFNNFLSAADEDAVKLNEEFKKFKNNNSNWLQKENMFTALSQYYGTRDFSQWGELDRNLYSKSTSIEERENRIANIEADYEELMEYENFKQFLADKQQHEAREVLNAKNIELYGDCLIGFSKSEMWGNIDCFRENLYYGGPDANCPETNNIQTWGLPALDYTKLGECSEDGDLSKLGEVGKFLYDKYATFFKRYDGLRMDAAWQFVTPFIYQAVNGNYEEVKLPEINFSIFNIMKKAAKDVLGDKFDEQNPDNIMLEMVGMSAGKSREMTLNTYPHLYTTAYAEYDESPAKFIEKGYKQGKFYVGVGCHDNDSLVNMSKDTQKRELHLFGMQRDYGLDTSKLAFESEKYKNQTEDEKNQEDYRTAKFSEIFTSEKQFFTLPDMFGMSERINISGKVSKDNWAVRIPSDYEKFYFSQLANGFGLNLPKVLANAINMKHINADEIVKKCNEAAEILRSDGPMTEQEANVTDEKGMLNHKFTYLL